MTALSQRAPGLSVWKHRSVERTANAMFILDHWQPIYTATLFCSVSRFLYEFKLLGQAEIFCNKA
jgi:hypothetical protein